VSLSLQGKTVRQIGREVGADADTVRKWVKQARG
jgi:transposase-like protein